ncbi:hypothetical protein [Burkholderia ubonensis]|uniref:hypothetical protein n=1 Tax=Burkholderia ubonensis TaxID=101571 RepID=UPI000753B497|nr:hypothetical protein [Burkholderia ubonensis]
MDVRTARLASAAQRPWGGWGACASRRQEGDPTDADGEDAEDRDSDADGAADREGGADDIGCESRNMALDERRSPEVATSPRVGRAHDLTCL